MPLNGELDHIFRYLFVKQQNRCLQGQDIFLKKNSETLLLVFCIIIVVIFKLWLVRVQTLSVAGGALYDERLFIRSAQTILAGDWLGPYDCLTLVKGPFYPIWIAFNHILGISLLLSQHLLYISASLVLVLAATPIFPGWKTFILVFIVLVFNPMSFAGEVMPRVMREGIYPALTMLCLAGALGIFMRSGQSEAACRPWSFLMALFLPAFWLTREEGLWIVPGLVILHVATCWRFYKYLKNEPPDFRKTQNLKMCRILVLPYLSLLVCIGVVSGINWYYYRVFTVVEVKSKPFTSAYGALSRTIPPEAGRYVSVPRDVRQKIYAVSPTFDRLRPYLEGSVGQKWIDVLCSAVPKGNIHSNSEFYPYVDLIEIACDDLAGGWFLWALRDSATAAGFHTSALKAQRFYRQIAYEINESCKNGRLHCLPERNSLVPPIKIKYLPNMANSMLRALVFLFSFKNFSAIPLQSRGTAENMSLFAHITGSRLYLPDNDLEPIQNNNKMKILNGIGKIYKKLSPWLVLSWICFVFISFSTFRKKSLYFSFFIAVLCLLAMITTRLVLLSIIDVFSFPAISTQYLSPIYPLMLYLCSLSVVLFGSYAHKVISDSKCF